MSIKSIKENNPSDYWTGTFKEFVTKMDVEWWKDKQKQLNKLSGSLDLELMELLPDEIRDRFLNLKSPQEFDEENDKFFLKTFKGDEGDKFEIRCATKLYKKTAKLPKKEHMKVRDVVFNLSADPSGSTLPNSHNPSFLKSLGGKGGLNKKIRDVYNLKNEHSTKTSVYQYRVPKTKWRVLWWVDFPNNILTIVDFIQRDKLDSKLSYKGVRGFKF